MPKTNTAFATQRDSQRIIALLKQIVQQNAEAIELCKQSRSENEAWKEELREIESKHADSQRLRIENDFLFKLVNYRQQPQEPMEKGD